MTDRTTPFWHKPLVRALERRFGKSTMPYVFDRVDGYRAYGECWRVTDVETGSYVECTYYVGRLRVHREHDASADLARSA